MTCQLKSTLPKESSTEKFHKLEDYTNILNQSAVIDSLGLCRRDVLFNGEKYPSDWQNFFTIAFENGVFSLTWLRGGTRNKFKSLQQVCQTAVIFYEELSER